MANQRIQSIDVPQQDNLSTVRTVVGALWQGVGTAQLGDVSGLSRRHLRYTLHAARTLGWATLNDDVWEPTKAGEQLLAEREGSAAEQARFRDSIASNQVLGTLAPDLLDPHAPGRDVLTARMQRLAGLSETTASRRAATLLRWREQVIAAAATEIELTALVLITFEASLPDTRPDDQVLLVGNLPELGAWDPASGIPLETDPWPMWRATVGFSESEAVEYKLVFSRPGQPVAWEPGANRTLHTGAAHDGEIVSLER